ncbi:DUF2326 domain-containing protein [Paenibacillus sp. alder61]|uniref:DUF2326 domain-containing protein n=1 Tax=Paenibacillus sp. alder61 TaxID=2862948 RepID=UPI001CD2E942|nr:DUF2326 domain-containing protein [Paenibacillus sp. alder61]MCA1291907.1 DUF2326 domain-containing protein [Paenibacillus sp. alder61]
MLKQISCDLFRIGTINFKPGLNVVLGDNQASNSIGKSTLLMIIDFVFGGTTYIEHNNDVVTELGHHQFKIILEFSDTEYYFIRKTIEPKIVYICNKFFDVIDEQPLEKYWEFLKNNYRLTTKHLSFRAAVSLYSRVWGKHNIDVKRPLHTFPKEKNAETVKRVLLLFNKYDHVIESEKRLKALKDSQTTINKASKYDYLPKISKSVYEKNIKERSDIEVEINIIKENIYKYTLNLSDMLSEEVFKLQGEKNELLKERNYFKARLNRINKNMKEKYVERKYDKLLEFFPNVNIERIKEVEGFHQKISKILGSELRKEQKELENKLNYFDEQLIMIDSRMSSLLKTEGQPNHLVQRMFDLSLRLRNIDLENKMYVETQNIKENIGKTSEEISEQKSTSLNEVNDKINKKIIEINDQLHSDKRRAPQLLLSENDYEYKVFVNKGTGKAYTNLFILDLSVLELTQLPILIHDSLLFKNIEDSVIENIIDIYNDDMFLEKQIFIAIDAINRLSREAQQILNEHKAVSLSNDSLLFTKDWRS